MAAVISAKAIGERRDELIVHVVLAQRSQGLDHQSADSTGSCHVLGSRLLEDDLLVADFDFAFRACIDHPEAQNCSAAPPERLKLTILPSV
jgi:hypothetical protein